MKFNITSKLITYFVVTLLLFSIIIGGFFTWRFTRNTIEHHKSDLEMRATSIATTLSSYLTGENETFEEVGMGMKGKGQGTGLSAYLKVIDQIAMSDIWVVDENGENITVGHSDTTISVEEITPEGEALIKETLEGDIVFGEYFSGLLGVESISVGVPIYNGDEIIGAVLLHSQIDDLEASINSGLLTLVVGIIVALILATITAILLSRSFVKPIKKMDIMAKEMMEGNYDIKTNIKEKDEIGDLANSLNILAEKLDEIDRLREDFYAEVSHELRTPVTVLRGTLEAFIDGKVKEDKKDEYYGQMLREISQLQNLVNDILDFSRLKNSDYVVEFEELNIRDVLSDVIRGMNQIADKKNIKIRANVDDFVFKGNYGRLKQMFSIILDNGIKYSHRDSSIDIYGKKNGNNFFVSIEDKGIGISREELTKLFNRYYRVTSGEGTGLGLAIAKEIANRHNVEILVESREGVGTTFTFKF